MQTLLQKKTCFLQKRKRPLFKKKFFFYVLQEKQESFLLAKSQFKKTHPNN